MSRNHLINFKKLIVTDTTCLFGQTVIGDETGKVCGQLQIKTDSIFEDTFNARRILPRIDDSIEINGLRIIDNGTLDMDCKNIVNADSIHTQELSAKDVNINFEPNINMIGDNKITWDCGIKVGNESTSTNECTGISIGANAIAGNCSLSLGNNAGNTTSTESLSIGDNAGNMTTGEKNINIGPNSSAMSDVNQTITIGCDSVADHNGAIVLGPGVSCQENMFNLYFPTGGGVIPGIPPGLIPAYLTICVNGQAFQVYGYLDDCYEPILTPFSQMFIGIGGISGQNNSDGNKQAYVQYIDKYTGESAPNGGFLVRYDAPGETNLGTYNYVSGLRIIDFNNTTQITMTMYDLTYNLYIPLNVNPNPPPECLDSWLVQTIPVLKWVDATNVQLVNFGTTATISWDEILSAQEYAVSITVIGTVNNSASATHYYGTYTSAPSTSAVVNISQTGNPGSYWVSVSSITARVVGYELCDKSMTPTNHCTIKTAAPIVDAGSNQTITLDISANLSGTVTDDGFFYTTPQLLWTKLSGPGTATFVNSMSASTSVSFNATGVYVLQLAANDGIEQTTDTVTITVNSAPINGSMFFSGAATPPYSTLDLPWPNDMNLPGDFTIEWWQYALGNPIYDQTIVLDMNRAFSGSTHDLMFAWRSAVPQYRLRLLGNAVNGFSASGYVNRWSHIALVRVGTQFRVYQDGSLRQTTTLTGTIGSTVLLSGADNIRLGNFTVTITSFDTFPSGFRGYITNFRYVVGTAVYTTNFTPPTTRLTAIPGTRVLLLGTNSGNPAEDSSGLGKVFTNNGVTWSSLNPF